jgi:hypothetical protein
MYVNASQAFMLNQKRIAMFQKRFHALNAPKGVKLAMVSIFLDLKKSPKIDPESKFLKF